MLDKRSAAQVMSSDAEEFAVLAATGGGNIGDQAMLEAVIQGVPGKIVVIATRANSLDVPVDARGRVRTVVLPGLLHPVPVRGFADRMQVRREIAGSRGLLIIGADLMDGLYNPGASIGRSSLAFWAAGEGIPTRILGFSWPESPIASARRALERASSKATVMPRDPVSAERLREQGITRITPVADLVFDLDATAEAQPAVAHPAPLAIVNISALVGARIDQGPEYQVIFDELKRLGFTVMVLPHVIRASGDDLVESQEVLAKTSATVELVSRLLTPTEVKNLVLGASLVVTGRMHLAIIALSSGVPAVTLGTHGKVEGLYELVGLQRGLVSPSVGFGARVAAEIRAVVECRDSIVETITSSMPRVLEMSRRNLARLDVAPSYRDED